MTANGRRTRSAVLITASEPEPRTFGKQVVLGGLLDHLCARLGPDHVHVVVVGAPREARPTTPYRLHRVTQPTAGDQLGAVARRVLFPPHSSLQEAALWSRRVLNSLTGLLPEIDADVEIWDTMRVGQYARVLPRQRRILYADDLFSKRYESMVRQLRTDRSPLVNPLGEFQRNLPRLVAPVVASRRVYGPLLRLEQSLTRRSEDTAPQNFDATVLVSAVEAGELAERTANATVRTLLPLIPEPRQQERRYAGAPTFVFLGSLNFSPNRDGLSWFLRSCREPVLSALPDFRLLLVGRGSDVPLEEARPWGDHVRPLGWVDDLDDVLKSCAALISPLRIGSGIKIKVLEALARGLPVVATPDGVLGLGVGAVDGCLVGQTAGELTALLVESADLQRNSQLSTAARASWQHRFCPEVASRAYDDLFRLDPDGQHHDQVGKPPLD